MLPAELQKLIDEIDAGEREAEALVADLSDEEVNWQEQPGATWSVAQCLDHLATINTVYLPVFLEAAEHARDHGGPRPFKGLQSTAVGRWFIGVQEPPVRRRIKAPKQAVPRSNLPRDGLVGAFKASHEPYRALVAACALIDPNRVTARNPFLKFVRMRLSTVLRIVPGHDRRHLWQAQNVKRMLRARGSRPQSTVYSPQ